MIKIFTGKYELNSRKTMFNSKHLLAAFMLSFLATVVFSGESYAMKQSQSEQALSVNYSDDVLIILMMCSQQHNKPVNK